MVPVLDTVRIADQQKAPAITAGSDHLQHVSVAVRVAPLVPSCRAPYARAPSSAAALKWG